MTETNKELNKKLENNLSADIKDKVQEMAEFFLFFNEKVNLKIKFTQSDHL